ncbi:MAG: hypothetical protein U5L09_05770 [Bacteroidales bacterium]|nr:hypothetical protein [Bacteroidales bacterium]
MGRYPGIHAVTIDADRNIAFENDAFASGIVSSIQQLLMQMVLDEVMDGDIIVVVAVEIGDFINNIFFKVFIFTPPAENWMY